MVRNGTPVETLTRRRTARQAPVAPPSPPPSIIDRVLFRALSPKQTLLLSRLHKENVFSKLSTQNLKINKPIPGPKIFYRPHPLQKAVKVSTPKIEKALYAFPRHRLIAFRRLHAVHSVKFYDQMISMLIAEVTRG